MHQDNEVIVTKIDALIDLLLEKKRIDSLSAARVIGESEQTAIEWAKALEKEGIVEIEYVFTKTFFKLAKGAENKIIRKKTANIEQTSASLLNRAEEVAKLALDTTRQLSVLDEISNRIDYILNTDFNNVGNIAARLEELKNRAEKYQNEIGSLIDQLAAKADTISLRIDHHMYDIMILSQKIDEQFNTDTVAKVKQSIETLNIQLSKIVSDAEAIKSTLSSYEEIRQAAIKYSTDLKHIRESLSPDILENLGKKLLEARKIVNEYEAARADIEKYESFLSVSVSEADKKISELKKSANEIINVYNKAILILGVNFENVDASSLDEINEKIKILNNELDQIKDLSLEINAWLSSDDVNLTINEYSKAIKDKKKYIKQLKDYTEQLAEIKPEINHINEETKFMKVNLHNELRDIIAEVNDLLIGVKDIEDSVKKWKAHESEYLEFKAKLSELLQLKNEIYKTVEKINKEISILYMRLSDSAITNYGEKGDDDGSGAPGGMPQSVSPGVMKKPSKVRDKGNVDEILGELRTSDEIKKELESDIEKVDYMSESYRAKKAVVEELLKKLWENEQKTQSPSK